MFACIVSCVYFYLYDILMHVKKCGNNERCIPLTQEFANVKKKHRLLFLSALQLVILVGGV